MVHRFSTRWLQIAEGLLFALCVFCAAPVMSGAQLLDNKGTEFIFAFQPNFSGNATEVHLTADAPTDVTVEYPVNAPTFTTTVAVVPGAITIVEIPVNSAQDWVADVVQNNAVRLSGTLEFVAYLINRRPFSTDAALGLPVDTMNTLYIVSTYDEAFLAAQATAVAAFDNTTVTITPSQNLQGGHAVGVPFNVTLNRGEGFMVRGADLGANGGLAGTIIESDKPIGVTNGNGCTQVPIGTTACDHIFEIAQPVQTWGKEAIVVNLPNRPNGSIYRVVGSEDGTTVTIDGVPSGTVDRGSFIEIGPLPDSHVIAGDKPIYVTQYMTGVSAPGAVSGDPAMGNMIPKEQWLSQYTFSTVGNQQFAEHFLTIIAQNEDIGTIVFDGAPIGAGSFTAIPGTNFSSAVLPLQEGTHTTSSTNPHGITVEGYNSADSYLYPGGARFAFINPRGDANPPICAANFSGELPGQFVGTATDNRPTEDVNGNSVLDEGEDINNNGQIDKDTGVFFVELLPGATNLSLAVDPFVPGSGSVSFVANVLNSTDEPDGTLRVTDGAGNTCELRLVVPRDLGCSGSVSILGEQFALDGNALEQKILINKALVSARKIGVRTLEPLGVEAESIYIDNWTEVWTLPSDVKTCTNTTFCATALLSDSYNEYLERSQRLQNMIVQIQKKVLKAKKRKNGARISLRVATLVRGVKRLHKKNQQIVGRLPQSNSTCSI